MRKPTARAAGKAIGVIGAVLLLLLWWGGGRTDPEAGARSAATRTLPEVPAEAGALIERLRRTRLLNGEEVYRQLGLGNGAVPTGGNGFLTRSPHGHGAVLRWYSSLPGNTEVCGVRFVDADRVGYRLRTFPDRERALEAGYVITHRRHCGACSSLRDFATYLAKPDLTSPARTCARRLTRAGVKACFMEEVGLDERCAEAWAYNALHTRRRCAAACIGHYGLWNVLTNDFSAPNTDEDGNLNPCLACDERVSGPGFQYAAGRTRRSSGLTSAISRPAAEIHPVDHTLYLR